jgi:hypothetical protein
MYPLSKNCNNFKIIKKILIAIILIQITIHYQLLNAYNVTKKKYYAMDVH